jgi:hypothetical protein
MFGTNNIKQSIMDKEAVVYDRSLSWQGMQTKQV